MTTDPRFDSSAQTGTVHPNADDLPEERLVRLERLAHSMDSRFRVPGTQIRFGWDSILGLVPGVGDVAAMAPSGYILLEAHRMGAPGGLKARMAANIGIDWVVGSIPLIGDLLDVGLKANRRNVALLRDHVSRSRPNVADRPDPPLVDPAPDEAIDPAADMPPPRRDTRTRPHAGR